MIIYGFADSIDACGGTLTGDHAAVVSQSDTFKPTTIIDSQRMAGTGGVFRAYADVSIPGATTLQTKGWYIGRSAALAQSGARAWVDNLVRTRVAKIWWVEMDEYYTKRIPQTGDVMYTVDGTTRIGAAPKRCRVIFLNANNELLACAPADAFGSYSIEVPSGAVTQICKAWFYTYLEDAPADDPYENTASYTLSGDVTKNVTMTTETETWNLFWAYAQLAEATFTEVDKSTRWLEVSASFLLYDGLRYGLPREYNYTGVTGSPQNYIDMRMAGTYNALMRFEFTANTNPITEIVITNVITGATLTWAGTLAATKVLVIDAITMTCTNDAADDYAGITPGTGQAAWMWFSPVAISFYNNFTIAVTQTTARNYDVDILYSDTYLL